QQTRKVQNQGDVVAFEINGSNDPLYLTAQRTQRLYDYFTLFVKLIDCNRCFSVPSDGNKDWHLVSNGRRGVRFASGQACLPARHKGPRGPCECRGGVIGLLEDPSAA